MDHLIRPNREATITIDVTPESAGWDYLSYQVLKLAAGESYTYQTSTNEVALTLLSGSGTLRVGDQSFEVARQGVFVELGPVLYVPPGHEVTVTADSNFEFAIGGAPAEGKYPVRLFLPEEIKAELRGGGSAHRQVCHTLSYPLPAERLILYEVYVPGGSWSGWPPHCHDGYGGSAHLDETYHFFTEPEYGFVMHRNYRVDTDFDETFTATNGDLVLVTQGFHSTAPAPNCNCYFLNYLAGELIDDARATPPFDDPTFAYIKEDWDANTRALPFFEK